MAPGGDRGAGNGTRRVERGQPRRSPASRPPAVVLVARDRRGATIDGVLEAVDGASIAAMLGSALAAGPTVLCSPDHSAFAAVAAALGVPYRPTPDPMARSRTDAVPLCHVRRYVDRLRHWLRRFCGVSSHYLTHYLGWRRLLIVNAGRCLPGFGCASRSPPRARPTAKGDSHRGWRG